MALTVVTFPTVIIPCTRRTLWCVMGRSRCFLASRWTSADCDVALNGFRLGQASCVHFPLRDWPLFVLADGFPCIPNPVLVGSGHEGQLPSRPCRRRPYPSRHGLFCWLSAHLEKSISSVPFVNVGRGLLAVFDQPRFAIRMGRSRIER